MKVELIRFYYSPHDEPDQRYHIDNKRALKQLEQLKQRGTEVEILDVNEIEDLFPHYHRATVGPSVALRPVFGTKGALEEDFGRSVPALVCYESKDDLYPAEVFPRMDRRLERMLGINEVLDNLLTYGNTVAPAIEAPIPDEVEQVLWRSGERGSPAQRSRTEGTPAPAGENATHQGQYRPPPAA